MTDQTIISTVIKQGVMSNVATLFWETIPWVQRGFSNCVSVVDTMQTCRVNSELSRSAREFADIHSWDCNSQCTWYFISDRTKTYGSFITVSCAFLSL